MIRNYLLGTLRNLWRNRFYSSINVVGLAIGLAVGIMVLLWVRFEKSYDSFHKNASNIYKINSHLGTGSDASVWDGAPAPLAIFSRQSIPEVVNSMRLDNINIELLFKYDDKEFIGEKMAFVDSTFFTMLDFPMIKGDRLHPFPDMNSIILSETIAKKFFGKEDAYGKVLTTEYGNFKVTGIMKDFPENSNFQYSMLLPVAFDADIFAKSGGNGDWKTMDEDLGNYSFQTYLQLKPGVNPKTVSDKITSIFFEKKGGSAKDGYFSLQPLSTRHLVSASGDSGASQTVRIFFLVAILILLIASINYVNLSTARSMLRSKEVSVRKIIGAAKYQLFFQFILESFILFFLASLLAILIIYLLLPLYQNISGKHLVFDVRDTGVWLTIGVTILATLLLSAIYPSLLLSSFEPMRVLRGKLSLGIGKIMFRRILVVTQFAFSVLLIIGTLVIGNQLRYIRDKNLGFNRENVFAFDLKGSIEKHGEALRDKLLKQPGIRDVAFSNNSIIGEYNSTGDTHWEGKQEDRMFLIHTTAVNERFIPLFNLQMAEGQNFSGSNADSTHFILNEAAIRQTGIKDPIGKSFTLWQTKGTIIGVVKDYNYASLKKSIDPMIFYYQATNSRVFVKTTGKDAALAIESAQKAWKELESEYPFSYSFVDEEYDRMYKDEKRTGALFNLFAGIAIFISCLGLLGLVTYTGQIKVKEIGIRKVLGATVPRITIWMAKEFLLLVGLAFVIASPVAWWIMNNWLENFAFRVELSGWVFLTAALISIFFTLLTVGFQAVKSAVANPVKSLRTE